MAAKYGTKVELFAVDQMEVDSEERRNNYQVNQSQRQESTLIEEENKKLYTALLQNQVLGIDNPFLLHEIHNSDENFHKDHLYSQLQRQCNPEDPAQTRKNTLMGSSAHLTDASPFNSKYTVLKFNNSASPVKHSQGGFIADSGFPRGLFSNSSNYAYPSHSEGFSQFSQSSMLSGAACENMSPAYSQHAFKHNPLSGFDEDSVIVPKKK